jgi:signal transduction histidine kinase
VGRREDSGEQRAVENDWLRWMLNAFADPVVLTDADHAIVDHNTRAAALFKDDPTAAEAPRRVVADNLRVFTGALSTLSAHSGTGEPRCDVRLRDPTHGSELLFELRTLAATNRSSGAHGTVAVLRNITDPLNLIMHSVPNPIILLDTDNQPILMNHEASRMFEAAGNTAVFSAYMASRLDGERAAGGEIVLIDPDSAEPVTMSITSTVVGDDLGGIAATVAVMQDVSRHRELERRRLEQILFDSEKLAATGRLAASIAHEINNPLEAIKNSLYLLTKRIGDDDPSAKFLQIATKETERVSRILRQMLGFYRAPKMEPTDVNRLIEESEGLIEKHLRQNHVRLHNDLDPHLPPIVASADQIRQVLLNLILNGQQAMPDGGTIFVSTRVSRDADPEFLVADSVHIQVRDTGSGIDPELVPHIFEPFFSTKDVRGTGLGLWVSQGIVQAHGGSIKLRSRAGRGTVFSVALPIGGPNANLEG